MHKEGDKIDHLFGCAKAFEHLLDVQYHIILGRKNQLTELHLRFEPTEFHHLVGLHKLRDLRLARGNREKIFQQILSKTICMEDIKKSRYFPEIQDRIDPFDKIEHFLDSNKLIFRHTEEGHFFCRSFFQKGEKDYTKGQAIYTLLKKEKTILSTGKTMVQYDRLMSGKI